jgi:hypothetical protein
MCGVSTPIASSVFAWGSHIGSTVGYSYQQYCSLANPPIRGGLQNECNMKDWSFFFKGETEEDDIH